MKKIYFTTGLPRSGNTLFASILNQNPNITATGHSATPDIFAAINQAESKKIFSYWKDQNAINNVYSSIFHSFYKDYKTPYVIERADWISPFNMSMLYRYTPNEIKIVILVRDILDIIKSFLVLCQNNPNFFINQIYNDLNPDTLYLPELEEKADIIMSKEGFINFILLSINFLNNNNLLHLCHFVEYNDLIENPKEVFDKVYDFYGIDRFSHNFESLQQLSVNGIIYDDTLLGAPMHELRTSGITKKEHNIVLPDKVISKYSGLEQWRSFNA